MFFQNRSLGLFLEGPSAEMVPFSIFMGFKSAPFGQPFRPSRRNKKSTPNDPGRTSRDPALHETKVITVPFGPSVKKNFICSMKSR